MSSNVDKKFKGIQFLYFHYIYDDEMKNAEKIIQWIAENFKVISYSEAIQRLLDDNIDDYYICFSSDDGLKSNMIASKIFKKYNISCCFFINPATIENRELAYQNKICTERLGIPLTDFLTWEDVGTLLAEGHEIGNHSYDHQILGDLNEDEFEEDLKKSTKILKEKIGEVKHFAFPRGQFNFFKAAYKKMTHAHGYTSCATAERGCHIALDTPISLNELSVRRDVVVFKEPLAFVKYFMQKSQQTSSTKNSYWIDNQ
ncbi:polysaccharide deacetylase family protein [uncultured Kordia sp.]|uniref:polysaccharide deacetylase family protein n=1 Tax=uncultured Kordia sp. TaxID=507699 RepID=UPI0026347082|nr:polysaccharide deacetylase family protein [uncultured Kordia sp.]